MRVLFFVHAIEVCKKIKENITEQNGSPFFFNVDLANDCLLSTFTFFVLFKECDAFYDAIERNLFQICIKKEYI